jgi:hypothetical protein
MVRQLLLLVLLSGVLASCKKGANTCDYAYFGGEIINPNNNYLLFYDDTESTLDTVFLDKNNRFLHKAESLNPGLHSFVHGSEYQAVFLEPNDSVMIRLNTYDFDESLVFTGKGAKKNNYLINLFVDMEREERIHYRLSKLDPVEFSAKIDSLRLLREQRLLKFKDKVEYSPLFEKVAKTSIDYYYYAHKELFPFRYFGRSNLRNQNLPKDFYAYRDAIDYNDNLFKDFFLFYNFLIPHFDNLALDGYFKKTNDSIFNRNSVVYNLEKLRLMDSLVTNKTVKNNLLKYCTKNYLSNANTMEDCEVMYDAFIKLSTNEDNNNQISHLFGTLRELQPGYSMPDIELLNYRNEVINLKTQVNSPTVIVFWTKAIQNHFINSHKRLEALRADYPDINFMSININSGSYPIWERLILQNNFPIEHEYRFRKPDAARKLLAIHYINKVMVVDKNNRIISSNANIFSSDFNHMLKDLN